jgi:hypothetical protein
VAGQNVAAPPPPRDTNAVVITRVTVLDVDNGRVWLTRQS